MERERVGYRPERAGYKLGRVECKLEMVRYMPERVGKTECRQERVGWTGRERASCRAATYNLPPCVAARDRRPRVGRLTRGWPAPGTGPGRRRSCAARASASPYCACSGTRPG